MQSQNIVKQKNDISFVLVLNYSNIINFIKI
jgi:hypothetical protein